MKKILLSSVLVASLFVACSSEKEEEKVVVAPVAVTPAVVVKKENAIDSSVASLTKVVSDVTKKVKEVSTDAEAKINNNIEKISKKVEETTKQLTTLVGTNAIDGSKFYGACMGCHGADGSQKALSKSAVIKGWSEAKIYEALAGYKNGTYGAGMKAIMNGQVKKFSDEELKALALHISKF